MFDSFDDDEYDERTDKTNEYFSHNPFNLNNNPNKQLRHDFIEYEDDESEDFCKKPKIEKNFDFALKAISCEQIISNTENQREKSILESDNKLDLSNSNKFSSNQLAKTKIDLYLNRPFQIVNNSSETSSSKSLKQKLLDLYLEESKRPKTTLTKYVSFSTNLLEKLVIREKYNTIVLNLYSQNEGYSFGFNIKSFNYFDSKSEMFNLNKIETKLVSYEETDIFFYINTGEIPPILIDLVDHLNVNLFYDGCVILEIRDYRRKTMPNTSSFCLNSFTYDLNFVLLRPSMQTLLADINSITKTGNCIWTQEDKYALESQLLLATAQPLCLEPNPVVSIVKNKILSYKYRLSDRCLKKLCLRHSEAFKLRALKWHEYELPYPFRILKIRKKFSNEGSNFLLSDFMIKNEIKIQENSKLLNYSGSSDLFFKESFESWHKSRPFVELPPQNCILVKEFSKKCEKPKYTSEPSLIPIEEILLEAEDKSSKNNYSKILILQQSNDGVYYGQLTLRSDQKSKVNFRLGSASDAEKYIQQYIQIFNEDGRRKVNLKRQQHKKPVDDKSLPCSIKKPFQTIFPSTNYNDKQVQSYQLVLQQQEQQQEFQQRNHIEQIRRSRSTSSDCPNSNLKSLVTQTSSPTSVNSNIAPTTPKLYPNIQPNRPQNINQTTNIAPTTPNIITLNSNKETTDIPNGILHYQKVVTNSNPVTSNCVSNNSNNVIQVLVPKLVQGSQNVNQTTIGKISPITQTQNSSILTNAVAETQPKNSKKSPKNKTTPKRQPKKRTNSSTNNNSNTQINLAPKTSTDMTNGDQNFKPKIINASSLNLLKKIPIDNRSVPVIVTLNSDSNNGNKLGIKSNEDSSPVKAASVSSPIKATTIQFLQKSTPVISLNSTQNKIPIYNQEITSVTSVASSPIKKTSQELFKQANEPIYITSPTTAKSVQSRQNFILPSVKTIPINSKTNQHQYLTTSASLDNQKIFNNKQLNSNQQTTSVILLTNNSNSSIQKSNSLN